MINNLRIEHILMPQFPGSQPIIPGIKFIATTENETNKSFRRDFPNASYYQFLVKSGENILYNSRSGMMGIQTIIAFEWQPKEIKIWEEIWDKKDKEGNLVPEGSYTIEFSLSGYQTVSKRFSTVATGVPLSATTILPVAPVVPTDALALDVKAEIIDVKLSKIRMTGTATNTTDKFIKRFMCMPTFSLGNKQYKVEDVRTYWLDFKPRETKIWTMEIFVDMTNQKEGLTTINFTINNKTASTIIAIEKSPEGLEVITNPIAGSNPVLTNKGLVATEPAKQTKITIPIWLLGLFGIGIFSMFRKRE